MTDHEPADMNNSELFAQVAKIFTDAKTREPLDFNEIEHSLDILDTERQVVAALASILPKYADIRDMLTQNDTMELMEAVASLQDQIMFMPGDSVVRIELENVRRTLFTCVLLANEVSMQRLAPGTFANKREYSRRILLDDGIFEDEKTALMQLTDHLLNGADIDTSDPDDVLMAINEHDVEQARDDAKNTVRATAAQKIKNYLASSYTLTDRDPEYISLVSNTSFFIASHVDNALNEATTESFLNSSTFKLLIEENVTALGIKLNDIVEACRIIAQELVEASQTK